MWTVSSSPSNQVLVARRAPPLPWAKGPAPCLLILKPSWLGAHLYSNELLLSGLEVRPFFSKAEEDLKRWWSVGLTLLEQDEFCIKIKASS